MASKGRSGPIMRVGIAGLGVAAANLLPELAAYPHARITAGADLRPEALERFSQEFGGETYSTVEELCHSPNVDLVYICTPSHLHAEHAILAAEHGKQIMADKPMALTLEECDAILEAVEHHGVRLLVGHSQSLDPPVLKMADMVHSGQLGKLIMINTWAFLDWVYRPRSAEEMEPNKGAGVVYRQAPIQVDIVRMLGGGLVRSVRATTSAADPARPFEGSYAAFLEFEEGTGATMVFNGYGHFDTAEITYGIGLGGTPVDADSSLRTRQRVESFAQPDEEWAYKDSTRYGGSRRRSASGASSNSQRRHAFFGLTLVSCERGDIRQTPEGIIIYGDHGRQEVPVPAGETYSLRYTTSEMDEMYDAWINDRPLRLHDGRWAKATLEVCLGITQSARERREVTMIHQTPYSGGILA